MSGKRYLLDTNAIVALHRVDVIGLTSKQTELIGLIVKLRQQYRLKLPDAIIVAMAIQSEACLVTTDSELQDIQDLEVVNFA